jgi:hypothetical protein
VQRSSLPRPLRRGCAASFGGGTGKARRGEARWVAGGWEQRGGGANRVAGGDARGRSEREREKENN